MRLNIYFAALVLTLASALGLSAQTVRVVFVSGQAELQRPDEATPRAVVKGETVIIGTRFVTGADGRIVLTPMPGVKSIITPNTTVVLESVSETRTSATAVTQSAMLDLKQGAVVSDLQKQPGVSYDYNIRTTRGIAGARGTNYTVGINAAGIQTIVVSHGNIALTLTDGRQVSITPGQISISQTNGDTQRVNKVSELSPADKTIAQKWAETTLDAIVTAVDAGELPPEALRLAVEAAAGLGIKLTPETQARIDHALSLSAKVDGKDKVNQADIKTVIEANSEIHQETETPLTGYASFSDFLASLTDSQKDAIGDILDRGFTHSSLLENRLRDGKFAEGLVNVINLYIELDYPGELLQSLGMLGNDNITAVGADIDGLRNLINAYRSIETPQLLNEHDYDSPSGQTKTVQGSSFFFPGQSGNGGSKLYNVVFDAAGADSSRLTIGATRALIIDNTGHDLDTFVVNTNSCNSSIELRAADLVDLTSTRFSNGVKSIKIEAATLNLTNINFPGSSWVTLNSRYGGTANGTDGTGIYPHFGSPAYGRVNFISGVKYDGNALNTTGDFDAHGNSIQIGTLNRTIVNTVDTNHTTNTN